VGEEWPEKRIDRLVEQDNNILTEQRRIVARLDEHQAKVGALKKYQVRTAEELDALLPSVLDRVFRGQL